MTAANDAPRSEGKSAAGPRLGTAKKLFFLAIIAVCGLLIIEGGLRVFYAFQVGPSVLLYGTSFQRQKVFSRKGPLKEKPGERTKAAGRAVAEKRHNVRYHDNELDGYSKYFPNQQRVDFDPKTGEVFPVTINSRGFRGGEFEDAKAPGTLRVLTLGASSTFGYHDRDDETYPVYLERLLNERCPQAGRWEVINLGIPHQNTNNILALFRAEGAGLAPDVVTFYEGINDASLVKDWVRDATQTRLGRLLKGPSKVMLSLALIDSLAHSRIEFDTLALYEQYEAKARDEFIENLSSLRDEVAARGAEMIFASQIATSTTLDHEALKKTTYDDEVALVRERVQASGEMESNELKLMAHAELMAALEGWTGREDLPYVDLIALADGRRDVLVSNVHLSPRGNRLVAGALAETILAQACAPAVARAGD